ncbi:hypothetical protein [Chengkuizengella marina]|uniref:Uncharacterized protein n=1 Tax=Chengkuizengella marina TaxID=2507566 RepID=A0A6N9Q306_9BACL|nr:hypothetical protein [Chengkuizengella marina]NBI29170.1 hypothetical protein [Chengkuizengella marina]
MKIFKKISVLALAFTLTTTSGLFSPEVLASEKSSEKKIEKSYKNSIKMGKSEEEARFIALFSDRLKKNKGKLNFENVEPVSDKYVKLNPSEYKSRLLDLDEAAVLREIITVNRLQQHGMKDLKKYQEKMKEKEKGSKALKYTYSDGSSVSFEVTDEIKIQNNEVVPNYTTEYNGPWAYSDDFGQNYLALKEQMPARAGLKLLLH